MQNNSVLTLSLKYIYFKSLPFSSRNQMKAEAVISFPDDGRGINCYVTIK